ncbi:pleiotropic drug resistance ABC transporter [Agrocybe pediades]|nr:pleiotropic drug resistance ABC transporter [Agrocybe pediades]
MSGSSKHLVDEGIPMSELPKNFDYAEVLRSSLQSRLNAGIGARELGVTFQNLHVTGLGASASYQATIGSIFNPLNFKNAIQAKRHPAIRDILNGFSGCVRPGEMLLVLGRPGSGCSTLLKILSNNREEFHSVEGDVLFDSFLPQDIAKNYRGDVIYCPEDDVHFPTLTVEQTIQFAAHLRAPRQRLGQTRAEYAKSTAQILMELFGLHHAKDTRIGDHGSRGISGGERKRVSLCEALAARACVVCWDNATRGLDASTALEFAQALRKTTDIYQMTNVVSLYQASENIYNLFDKVCVLYEGRMAYFGPAKDARKYFMDLGYEPAHRQTTSDFLVAVTDPNARIPRKIDSPIPRTCSEFAYAYLNSYSGQRNMEEIASYRSSSSADVSRREGYTKSAREEHEAQRRKESSYIASVATQTIAVLRRRYQILRGNMTVTIIRIFGFLFQGVILGTVFLKLPDTTSAFYSRSGLLFFALFFSAIMALSEIPALFAQRPIILRHQQWALYHPFTEAVALTIMEVPITLLTSLIYGGLLYGLGELQKSAGQFFIFILFVFTVAFIMRAWFRALSAISKNAAAAQAIGGVSVLAMAMYTGYTLQDSFMLWPFKLISFINPLKYGFESLMANEFETLEATCANLVPQGPTYGNVGTENQVCTTVGSLPGQPMVQGARFIALSFGYSRHHLWRNFGILLAFATAFLAAYLLFTETNTKTTGISTVTMYKKGTPLDESEEDELSANFTRENPALQPHQSAKSNGDIIRQHDVFSFQNINYHIPVAGGQTRQLLNDVSGFVSPGSLTALMGESGAGKTTLLNVLAQRTDVGVISGHKYINGQSLPDDFQSQTGYCQQLDTHIPRATVREALLFSAQLRQPSSVPSSEKEDYVDKCLRLCGLWSHRNAIVGTLNVEFRKRTTIGVELAAKPRLLLFLDEPTSGLDSQSAWNIVVFLRDLADHGQAILCTIHQPSAELFHIFDRMLLLSKGGKTVYFGNLGHNSNTLLDYFARNGARPCGPEENPAEYMLDAIGAGATAYTDVDWHDIWRKSPEAQDVMQEIDKIHATGRSRPALDTVLRSQYPTPWINQFVQLVRRGALDHYRNKDYIIPKIALNITAGWFIGFTFFKHGASIQLAQNKLFSIYMAIIVGIPLANQLQVPYVATRTVYETRERPSRMYSWSALVASQILVEIPWNILGSSLFFCLWYWTSHFPTDRGGYAYLALGIIFPLYYTTIAQSIASMAPTAETAQVLFGILFPFVLTFNGVLQPFSELGWWRWMYRLSPYTYLVEGLVGETIGRHEVVCSAVEYVTITPPENQTCGQYLSAYISMAGGYVLNPNASQSCQFCGIRNTDEFLGFAFNIFYRHRWRNFGIMFAFIAFNVFTIFVFTYVFRIHSGSWLPFRKKNRD